ncbi:FCP1 homology domain [Dillenia turbinata]|uniref:FCP1 homology domain n=1 Tax=Dillenia turbinata TaxID=194707 RepID=A0AAN8VDR6_9MAGN
MTLNNIKNSPNKAKKRKRHLHETTEVLEKSVCVLKAEDSGLEKVINVNSSLQGNSVLEINPDSLKDSPTQGLASRKKRKKKKKRHNLEGETLCVIPEQKNPSLSCKDSQNTSNEKSEFLKKSAYVSTIEKEKKGSIMDLDSGLLSQGSNVVKTATETTNDPLVQGLLKRKRQRRKKNRQKKRHGSKQETLCEIRQLQDELPSGDNNQNTSCEKTEVLEKLEYISTAEGKGQGFIVDVNCGSQGKSVLEMVTETAKVPAAQKPRKRNRRKKRQDSKGETLHLNELPSCDNDQNMSCEKTELLEKSVHISTAEDKSQGSVVDVNYGSQRKSVLEMVTETAKEPAAQEPRKRSRRKKRHDSKQETLHVNELPSCDNNQNMSCEKTEVLEKSVHVSTAEDKGQGSIVDVNCGSHGKSVLEMVAETAKEPAAQESRKKNRLKKRHDSKGETLHLNELPSCDNNQNTSCEKTEVLEKLAHISTAEDTGQGFIVDVNCGSQGKSVLEMVMETAKEPAAQGTSCEIRQHQNKLPSCGNNQNSSCGKTEVLENSAHISMDEDKGQGSVVDLNCGSQGKSALEMVMETAKEPAAQEPRKRKRRKKRHASKGETLHVNELPSRDNNYNMSCEKTEVLEKLAHISMAEDKGQGFIVDVNCGSQGKSVLKMVMETAKEPAAQGTLCEIRQHQNELPSCGNNQNSSCEKTEVLENISAAEDKGQGFVVDLNCGSQVKSAPEMVMETANEPAAQEPRKRKRRKKRHASKGETLHVNELPSCDNNHNMSCEKTEVLEKLAHISTAEDKGQGFIVDVNCGSQGKSVLEMVTETAKEPAAQGTLCEVRQHQNELPSCGNNQNSSCEKTEVLENSAHISTAEDKGQGSVVDLNCGSQGKSALEMVTETAKELAAQEPRKRKRRKKRHASKGETLHINELPSTDNNQNMSCEKTEVLEKLAHISTAEDKGLGSIVDVNCGSHGKEMVTETAREPAAQETLCEIRQHQNVLPSCVNNQNTSCEKTEVLEKGKSVLQMVAETAKEPAAQEPRERNWWKKRHDSKGETLHLNELPSCDNNQNMSCEKTEVLEKSAHILTAEDKGQGSIVDVNCGSQWKSVVEMVTETAREPAAQETLCEIRQHQNELPSCDNNQNTLCEKTEVLEKGKSVLEMVAETAKVPAAQEPRERNRLQKRHDSKGETLCVILEQKNSSASCEDRQYTEQEKSDVLEKSGVLTIEGEGQGSIMDAKSSLLCQGNSVLELGTELTKDPMQHLEGKEQGEKKHRQKENHDSKGETSYVILKQKNSSSSCEDSQDTKHEKSEVLEKSACVLAVGGKGQGSTMANSNVLEIDTEIAEDPPSQLVKGRKQGEKKNRHEMGHDSEGETLSVIPGQKNSSPSCESSQNASALAVCDMVVEIGEKSEEKLEKVLAVSSTSSEVEMIASAVSSCLSVSKESSDIEVSHSLGIKASIGASRRKLLVLDVNGLLADVIWRSRVERKPDIWIAGRAIFKRPFCDDFLRFCFENFDVGVWSSRSKKYLYKLTDYLLADMSPKLLFCWDASRCTDSGSRTLENRQKPLVFKELKKIWEKAEPNLPWEVGDYDESNTLLLDDSPYKALLNPAHTAVFPFSYTYQSKDDNSLGPGGALRVYIENLAAAENVQKYVQEHPFGQQAINETSSFWPLYKDILNKIAIPTKAIDETHKQESGT